MPILDALPGMLIILALVVLTDLLLRVIPKLPAVFVLSVLAMTAGCPGVLPYSEQIIALVGKVNFLPFTTVILAMAGLSILRTCPPSASWAGRSWSCRWPPTPAPSWARR